MSEAFPQAVITDNYIFLSGMPGLDPITGKVTNEKGEPLQGASVTVRGTTRGTTTNAAGVFSIDAEEGQTLEFSMV